MACGAPLGVVRGDERKPVTILFTDVAGSTALSERLEPEAVRRVMLRYFDAVARVIARHGGTIEKFIGDAVMAVFGAPVALEDHAQRAVRAAQELEQALAEVNDDLRSRWGVQIAVRTGINSGEVVAGDTSAGQALVTGDAVNVAARLQQAAAPGETLIGDLTRRLVAGTVDAEPLEPLAVRGKAEPLIVWRLSGAGGDARAVQAPPLQGRDRELGALREAFERVAYERAPQRVVVLGPAGIGKSRLAAELEAALRDRATVLTGRCLPYGEGITFWALGEIVRQLAGGGDVHAALVAALPDAPHAELLAERVLQAAGLEEVTGSREDLTRAVTELFESVARRTPLVLVFEDLHWAEPPLLDLVEHLLERTRDAPVMLVCLAREDLLERRPDWRVETPVSSTLELEPLSAADTRALVRALLPTDDGGGRVDERLADRAEGNPLFAEQLVALMREGGEVTLPPTIQALLAARLDRLAPPERAAVGAAAVVGREFWGDAVATLLPDQDPRGVQELLTALARKRLVMPEESTLESEAGYSFTHVLVRDAAYEALTKQDRAELHERVADWLERRHPERMIEIEAIVGYHLECAYRHHADLGPIGPRAYALAQRAARRLAGAGGRAGRAREDAAAAGLLERAGALLPASGSERLELLPAMGGSLEGMAQHTKAGEVYEEALERALALGNARVEGLARLGRAHVWFVAYPDVTGAQIVAETEQAIGLLTDSGEHRGLADAWRLLGEARMYEGRAGEGQQALAHALELVDPDREPRNWNAISFGMGMCLLDGPAPLDEAAAFARERLGAARDRSMRSMEADMLHVLGVAETRAGRFGEAREALTASAAISEELGLLYMAQWSQRNLGHLELAAGDPQAAESALRKSWDVLTEMGLNSSLGETAVPLAEALHAQGRDEQANETLRVVKEEWASGDVSVSAPRLAVRARLLAAEGWAKLALETAERAVRIVRRTDWLCLRADALIAHAEVARLAGEYDAAAESAAEALRVSEEKGYRVGLARAQVEAEQIGEPIRNTRREA
jgi:class 3 adenylate cyclase/tetratricopeptide (TPR) repeat protein